MPGEDSLDSTSAKDTDLKTENGILEPVKDEAPDADSSKEDNKEMDPKKESDLEDGDIFKEESKDDGDWTAPLEVIKEVKN